MTPPPPSHLSHQDVRIGTVVRVSDGVDYVRQVLPHGFESVQPFAWEHLPEVDLARYAGELRDALGDRAVVSSLAMFGNPLQDARTAVDFGRCIDAARPLFGCDVVAGFAGAIDGRPLPESLPAFRTVWGELSRRAEAAGVRIAFETCDMGGTWDSVKWNVAHASTAWEVLFNAVPSPALGLEWEPCHHLGSFVDPLPQLRKWLPKVWHLHGKDATVAWDVVRAVGIRAGQPYVWHRHPGFGDTNWTDVISVLRMAGWRGAIDIEGWHDPAYKDELEMTGQVRALNYLKQCRGGPFVPNPTGR